MAQKDVTSLLGGKAIGIEYTDKPVTPWGGLVVFSGLARQVGLEKALREALPFRLTSPNATDPVEIVLAFMAGVLAGSRRLAHIERLRWDEGVKEILGVNRFVSDTTLARFFRRFGAKQVTQVFEALTRWGLKQIRVEDDILDLDSSAFERYGKQEGALLGYNPRKRRRPSHHPLIATLGKQPWVVHAWLRSGNTSSARGADCFLEEALALLPEGKTIRFLRGDSGFGVEPFLAKVENKKLEYAIVARFTSGLKNAVAGLGEWKVLEPGIEVGEVMFQAQGWSRSRRVALIRQRSQKDDFVRGRELFDDPAYLYQAIITNMAQAPEEVWRFYRNHAEIEACIRELKWDYGVDGFCQEKFFATEAAFRFVCVLYNLLALLQKTLGFNIYRTLGTLRTQVFAQGAVLGRAGHKTVLRLSLAGPWRDKFKRFLDIVFPTQNIDCGAVGTT